MNILVAYFSRAGENYFNGDIISIKEGNTEVVANKITILTGGEVFKIRQAVPYSSNYDSCVEEGKEDKANNRRPEIVDCIKSIDNYDIIYLGYPNYWGSMPMCVFTFLEKFDFTGKIIRPFCTHEGSGFGNSIEELKSVCKGAKIEKGLAVVGSAARAYDEAIREWIDESFKAKN